MATEEVKSDGSASGVRIFTPMELLREREQKPAFDCHPIEEKPPQMAFDRPPLFKCPPPVAFGRPPQWAFDCHPIEEKPPQLAFDRPVQLAFDRPPLFKCPPPVAFDRPPLFNCPPRMAFDRPPQRLFNCPPPMAFDWNGSPLEKQPTAQDLDRLKAMASALGVRILTPFEWQMQKLKPCDCGKPYDCPPNPKHNHEEACNCFLVILNENNKIEHNHTIRPLPPLINPDDKKREFEQYMQYVSQKVEGEVFDIKDFPGSYTPKRIISLYDGSASDGHADYLAGKALEDFYSRHGMRYELVKVIMYHLAAHEYVTTYFITFKARKTGADPEDDSLTTFQARVSFGGRYKVEHCAIKQTSST